MTARSLIQRDWQVRALLAGRRTQVRVPVRGLWLPSLGSDRFAEPPRADDGSEFRGRPIPATHWRIWEGGNVGDYNSPPWEGDVVWTGPCPLGQPGDLLRVREAWCVPRRLDGHAPAGLLNLSGLTAEQLRPFTLYRADPTPRSGQGTGPLTPGRWRPSIHMPAWASRLTLRVLDVRCHRVREISEADAFAEGIDQPPFWKFDEAHCHAWDEIHGPGSWERDWCFAATVEAAP